jgi:hypothetical protein
MILDDPFAPLPGSDDVLLGTAATFDLLAPRDTPAVQSVEVLEVDTYARTFTVRRDVLDDERILQMTLRDLLARLNSDLQGLGIRYAGPPDFSVTERPSLETPPGRLRRAWLRLRGRPWTPRPPEYVLRCERRAA